MIAGSLQKGQWAILGKLNVYYYVMLNHIFFWLLIPPGQKISSYIQNSFDKLHQSDPCD